MNFPRHAVAMLLLLLALLLGACDEAATKYYLKLPVEARVLDNGITCPDGSVGYAAFVTDNTAYGGVVKLLDGCTGLVNEDFTDGTKGTGKGLLVGPVVAGFDLMPMEDGLLLAAAAPEEWSLVFKRLDKHLAEIEPAREPVALDLMPRAVDVMNGYFLVRGDDIVGERAALVAPDGALYPQDTGRRFAMVACDGLRCLAIEEGSGLPFLLTVTGPANLPLLIVDDAVLPESLTAAVPFAGVATLSDGRFVLWNGATALFLTGFEDEIAVAAELTLPFDTAVTTAASVDYIAARIYASLSDDEYFSKGTVYVAGSDEDDLFGSDEDAGTEDSLMDDNDALLRFALAATDVAATDADALVLPEGQYDARTADAIWFATDSGRIFSYDMVTGGWMFDPVDAGETDLPQLAYAGAVLPEEGDSTEANMPRIERITALRGLPFVVSYEATYEALFDGSLSDGGLWSETDSLILDDRADFTKYIVGDPRDYAVLLTGTRDAETCLVPARTAISLPVVRVVNGQALQVDPGLWADDIADCYGEHLSYGIYPRERYLVRVTLPGGARIERTAREMSAEWNPTASREVSYSDPYIDMLIKRRTDEVVTSRGLTYRFTVTPTRAFVGPDSVDIFERLLPLPNGHMLLFSPQRSRLFEYSPVYEETVVTYR